MRVLITAHALYAALSPSLVVSLQPLALPVTMAPGWLQVVCLLLLGMRAAHGTIEMQNAAAMGEMCVLVYVCVCGAVCACVGQDWDFSKFAS